MASTVSKSAEPPECASDAVICPVPGAAQAYHRFLPPCEHVPASVSVTASSLEPLMVGVATSSAPLHSSLGAGVPFCRLTVSKKFPVSPRKPPTRRSSGWPAVTKTVTSDCSVNSEASSLQASGTSAPQTPE
jgi:hypothetical protein